jgi:hypothetical protein
MGKTSNHNWNLYIAKEKEKMNKKKVHSINKNKFVRNQILHSLNIVKCWYHCIHIDPSHWKEDFAFFFNTFELHHKVFKKGTWTFLWYFQKKCLVYK